MGAVGFTSGDPRKVDRSGYAKGDVLAADAAGDLTPIPVGADTDVLTADSTDPEGVDWQPGGSGSGTGIPSNTVVSETSYGQPAAAGAAAAYSRGDHTHGTPSLTSSAPTTALGIGQAAAVGAAVTPARADHVHPMASSGTPSTSAVGDAPAQGAATTFARSDHTHGREGFATPTDSLVGDTQSAGVAATVARSDHRHAREAFGPVTPQTTFGQPSSNGAATSVARSDHTHGTPAAPGIPGAATSVVAETTFGQATAIGATTTYAREDHTHGTPPTPTAADVGADPAGSAAAAQAASLQKTANLSDLANATTARTNLGLGDSATRNVGNTAGTVAAGDDLRLSDARTPTAHAASHADGGTDEVTLAISQTTGLQPALDGKQPLDADLTAIAGLAPANDDVIQRKAGAWTNRTMVELKADLAITAGDVGAVPTSRTISTTAPLAGGGDLTANRTISLNADGVTNTLLANMPANTIKGNNSGSTADPADLTVSQVLAMLNIARQTQVWSFDGDATVQPGTLRWYNRTGKTVTIHGAWVAANTAPTGASLLADVNKNGTTIFTTQGNRPTVPGGGNGGVLATPDVTTIADGDYITVDIDQVGSTIAGADVTIGLVYE